MPAPGGCGYGMLVPQIQPRGIGSINGYLSLVFAIKELITLTLGLQFGSVKIVLENSAMATTSALPLRHLYSVLEFLFLIRTEAFNLVYSP